VHALFATTALATLLLGADAAPVHNELADQARFADTVALGKLLAETDSASASATDVLFDSTKPDESKVSGFFALLIKDHWFVYFGKVSASGDKYLPGYVLTAPRHHLKEFRLINLEDAPVIGPGYARAELASGLHAAEATHNPGVNPVLLAQPSGELDIYVLQATHEPGVVLIGGDWHDRWDATGKKLVSREQFHKSVIPQNDADAPEGTTLVGTYHTHILVERPPPTDVMEVLLHPHLAPMFVSGMDGGMYRIDRDGSIHTVDAKALKDVGIELPALVAPPAK
jgi:hypothetical protein